MHKVLGWAIQLILQLLIKQSNTFLAHCTHIEHMLEGVLIKKYFRQNDSCENLNIFPACVEYIWLCLCFDSAYTGGSTHNTAFDR